jgi:subtilisin family serine protease
MSPRRRTRRWAQDRAAAFACIVGAVTAVLAAPPASGAPSAGGRVGLYLVTFADEPAATYRGGVDGFPATATTVGDRFDKMRVEVSRYRLRLEQRQDDALDVVADVGGLAPVYRYTTVVSGVAVHLTATQAAALRSLPSVVNVERSTRGRLDSVDSAQFLGLTGSDGVWQRIGGSRQAGDGVVLGLVDSGVWPENPSFAAPPLPSHPSADGLRGFTGSCQAGDRWREENCDAKIVAARWFVDGFGEDSVSSAEYLSPRDVSGHGSHIAATAAGNEEVRTTVDSTWMGDSFGVAPGASIAVYKACWTAPDPADDGCEAADVLRALDQAVADGVDVVNQPISGESFVGTAMQRAFRNAATAGVVVITSAGNAGRRGVAPSSPWVTSVGASTFRALDGAAVLGDGTRLVGAMADRRGTRPTAVVLGSEAAVRPGRRSAAARCEPGALDAATVAGKVVVCERGVTARVDKSRSVEQSGGVAMVLLNTEPAEVDADLHSVPTVHLDHADGARLLHYLREAGRSATVALDPTVRQDGELPGLASFSGRGPGTDADLLKPDLVAPGVGVLAAVAPPSHAGRNWDVMSGTSMATAHVAGLAALIRSRHPRWSSAVVKSAMMTTAYDVTDSQGALGQGAGHIDPIRFLDPGLVFEAQPAESPRAALATNSPSIAVGDLVGSVVVRRTITNVSRRVETYNAAVDGVRGVDVSVVPASLRLAPGDSRTFRVRMVATRNARFDAYVSGALTWSGSRGHVARIPLAVRTVQIAVPEEANGIGASGAIRLDGTGGLTGRLPVTVAGLVGAVPEPVALTVGAFDPTDPVDGPATHRKTFEVPEGTAAVRFDVEAVGDDNVDLHVYRNDTLVASASGASPNEQVTLLDPEPGRYDVYTQLVGLPADGSAMAYFTGWVVPDRDTDTLDLPDTVPLSGAEEFALRARWQRLDGGQRWFGLVRFGSGPEQVVTPVVID